MNKLEHLYTKKILKEEYDASYENIGGSIYDFLEKLKAKHPELEDVIMHWMFRIDEDLQEIDSIATADMSPEEAQQVLGDALVKLRNFLKSD